MRDVCDCTGTKKSLLKAFRAIIIISSFQQMNELTTSDMNKTNFLQDATYTLCYTWMANLQSCMNRPKALKRCFHTRAVAPHPADGYFHLTRTRSDPTEDFSCISASAPPQSAEAGSPPQAETVCFWLLGFAFLLTLIHTAIILQIPAIQAFSFTAHTTKKSGHPFFTK